MNRLFVYGTLLRGQSNHALLAKHGRFVREAHTKSALTLWDLGPYPALTLGGQTSVAGEIWEVSDIGALDDFEGPSYARNEIELDDGSKAETYVLRGGPAVLLTLPRARSGARPIASGDWRRRVG